MPGQLEKGTEVKGESGVMTPAIPKIDPDRHLDPERPLGNSAMRSCVGLFIRIVSLFSVRPSPNYR